MGGGGGSSSLLYETSASEFQLVVLFPNNCHQGRAANFRGHMLHSLVVFAAPTWPSSQLLQV